LKVTGSTQRSPTDFIVQTLLVDPNTSQQPSEVDFRVRTDTGKPVLVDVAYQGIWLSLEERDQFVAFLGQNNGNVRTLIAHLSELAVNLGKPTQ
jgi:ABC-type transporter MlaC component